MTGTERTILPDWARVRSRIEALEAVSRQRDFTDEEIDEFVVLIRQHHAFERAEKRQRANKLRRITQFLEARC